MHFEMQGLCDQFKFEIQAQLLCEQFNIDVTEHFIPVDAGRQWALHCVEKIQRSVDTYGHSDVD